MMPFSQQNIRCPFCFKSFTVQRIRFRCTNPLCSGWTNDEYYAKARGIPRERAPRMGRVFEVEPDEDKRRTPRGVIPSAVCNLCSTTSYTHLCPECHFELAHDVGKVRQRIISVIGGVGTGKTHYIGALIFAMRQGIGNKIGFTTRMLGDDTQRRWEEEFYTPVFLKKAFVEKTLPAGTEARVKAPLVLRLTATSSLPLPSLPLLENLSLRQLLNTSIFDSSGEDMATQQTVSAHVRSILYSDGIMLIVDPLQIDTVRQQLHHYRVNLPNLDRNSQPEYLLGRLLTLFEEQGNVNPRSKIQVPLAIVLSKIDTLAPILDSSSALLNPSEHYHKLNLAAIQSVETEVKEYLRRWLTANFCDTIEQRFTSCHYFGVSALGRQRNPNQLEVIEPLRVEEPFLWLLYKKGFVKGQ